MRCTSIPGTGRLLSVFATGGEKGCHDSPSKSEFSERIFRSGGHKVAIGRTYNLMESKKGFQQRKRNDWMCVHFLVISVVIKCVGGPNGTRYLSPPVELVTAMPAVVQGDGGRGGGSL